MASVPVGKGSGPWNRHRTATDARPVEEHPREKNVRRGDIEPDTLLQCPFDKNHQIRSCRLPYHLIKCKKNHPELARELKSCPFNARHLVPKNELSSHTEMCMDKKYVDAENDESAKGDGEWQVPVSTWVNPNMTEDWDSEADDFAVPFVWSKTTNGNGRLDMRPTNNLGPSLRAPSTLPWSSFKP